MNCTCLLPFPYILRQRGKCTRKANKDKINQGQGWTKLDILVLWSIALKGLIDQIIDFYYFTIVSLNRITFWGLYPLMHLYCSLISHATKKQLPQEGPEYTWSRSLLAPHTLIPPNAFYELVCPNWLLIFRSQIEGCRIKESWYQLPYWDALPCLARLCWWCFIK